MQKFDTPAPISAVLDIPAGRVQFIAADRAGTVVEIRPADAANGRIHNALKNTGSTSGLSIHATTARGDITARSL